MFDDNGSEDGWCENIRLPVWVEGPTTFWCSDKRMALSSQRLPAAESASSSSLLCSDLRREAAPCCQRLHLQSQDLSWIVPFHMAAPVSCTCTKELFLYSATISQCWRCYVFMPFVHLCVHPGCCFHDIYRMHWWVFSKLLSVVHLGTEIN